MKNDLVEVSAQILHLNSEGVKSHTAIQSSLIFVHKIIHVICFSDDMCVIIPGILIISEIITTHIQKHSQLKKTLRQKLIIPNPQQNP